MKRINFLTGIVLACSTAAFAQDSKKTDELFKQLDTNNDGKLVADEIPEEQSRFFERLVRIGDADSNGELTQSEFSKATSETIGAAPAGNQPGRRPGNSRFDSAAFFKRLDRNGDGKLTADEAPEPGRRMVAAILERLNKGRDGSLTLQEFEDAVNRFNRGPQSDRQRPASDDRNRRDNADRPSGNLPMQRTGESDRPGTDGPAFLRILDANRDGRLTRDELAKAVVLLERLDQNQDGALDPRELFGGSRTNSMGRSREDSERSGSDRSRRPESESGDDRAKPAGTSKRPQRRRPENANAEQIFNQVDRDRNGKISREEAPDRMRQNFDRLDNNSDGSVSLDELQQAFNRSRRQK